MARKSTLSAQEIAEMDEMKQSDLRKGGFSLMSVRDRGQATLSNGAKVFWHTNNPPIQEFEDPKWGRIEVRDNTIPEGMFGIELGGKTVLFNVEELRRFIRWA